MASSPDATGNFQQKRNASENPGTSGGVRLDRNVDYADDAECINFNGLKG